MRWIAILGILAYRIVVRPFLRRRCLYPESCSTHAIRCLREHGYRRALPMIQARVRSCRLPETVCFVLDDTGRATVLAIDDGRPHAKPGVELLARHAEHVIAMRRGA